MNEEEEEEEGSWEEVKRPSRPRVFDTTKSSSIEVKRSTPEMEMEMEMEENLKRQWDDLPSTALLNIFCNTQLKDRFQSIPLVCKSWKHVTDDPRCWSLMIPASVSPEDAFIKNNGYKFPTYKLNFFEKKDYGPLIGISRLFKEEGDLEVVLDDDDDEEEEEGVPVGLSRLRTLIKKSGGGAAITTLYLSPFHYYPSFWWKRENKSKIQIHYINQVISLIANSCPNLKHISFNVHFDFDPDYAQSLLQLFNRCKKLELIDLSYSGCTDPLFIQELGSCLPNLRGFRIEGYEPIVVASIATYLPQLKLLTLPGSCSLDDDEHLSILLSSRLELQYLYFNRYQVPKDGHGIIDQAYGIIEQASAQIPEFDYDLIPNWDLYYESYDYEETDYTDYFFIDDYRDTLKQRKEDQYVSILKEKKEYHYILKKKKEDQCNSSLKKKKKKRVQYDSTFKKKKKDQCNYADYVIQ